MSYWRPNQQASSPRRGRMKITDEDAHSQLVSMAKGHVDLGEADGENVFDIGGRKVAREDMTDADWKAAQLAAKASSAARPGSVPAQVGKSVMGAALATAQPAGDLSKPLGYQPPHDAELERLQADAKQRRSSATVGQSVSDLTERPANFLDYAQRLGGGGVSAPPPKSDIWKRYEAEGDQAISDLGERRKSDTAMTVGADDSDPNSPTAQTYRAVMLKFAPDIAEQLKGANAKQMRQIAPWLEKFATENADALRANAAAEAKAKADADKAAVHATERTEDFGLRREANAASQANAAATRALAESAAKAKGVENIEGDVQKLSKELPGDEADFNRKVAEIRADIAATPGDIEGVGPVDSAKPVWMQSKRGLRMQKNAGQLQAAWKKLITGTGGGAAEMAQLDKIGIQLGNEDSFIAGLDALEKGYAEKVKSVRAGYRPEVTQTLDERRKREGVGAAPERKQSKSGRWMVKDADGDWSWE